MFLSFSCLSQFRNQHSDPQVPELTMISRHFNLTRSLSQDASTCLQFGHSRYRKWPTDTCVSGLDCPKIPTRHRTRKSCMFSKFLLNPIKTPIEIIYFSKDKQFRRKKFSFKKLKSDLLGYFYMLLRTFLNDSNIY